MSKEALGLLFIYTIVIFGIGHYFGKQQAIRPCPDIKKPAVYNAGYTVLDANRVITGKGDTIAYNWKHHYGVR